MQPATQPGTRRTHSRNTAFLVVALAVLWLVFSGKTDLLHLAYGVFSIWLVVLLTRSILVARRDPRENEFLSRMNWPLVFVYPFWLVSQVIIANVQVSWIIIRPSMPIDPVLLHFRTGMSSSLAKVTLGNSIILTPGTFTLHIKEDAFLVHTIHESLAASLIDGSMQRRVAALFGETLLDDLHVTVVRDPVSVRQEVDRWSS